MTLLLNENKYDQFVWLNHVYEIGKIDDSKALDIIFESIDKLFWNGQFNVCDNLLEKIDFNQLNPTLLIGFLSITRAAKSNLKNREKLVKDVEARLLELKIEDVKGLMSGLI